MTDVDGVRSVRGRCGGVRVIAPACDTIWWARGLVLVTVVVAERHGVCGLQFGWACWVFVGVGELGGQTDGGGGCVFEYFKSRSTLLRRIRLTCVFLGSYRLTD